MTNPLLRTVFPSDLIRIDGALDLENHSRGLRPRRLPAWTRAQYPDEFFDLIVRATAGVRLALRTTATTLEVTLHATRVSVPGMGPVPAALDLTIGSTLTRRAAVTGGDVIQLDPGRPAVLVPGEAETIRFTDLPAGDREVVIWLPQMAGIDLISLQTDADIHAVPAPGGRRWVHHGSSISQSGEAEGPTGTWPAATATATGLHLTSLGFAGNAMLDPFVARTIRDLPTDFISLEIGTNITEQITMRRRTFLPAVHGFLDTIREGHPDTPLLVISPIPCPVLEDRPGPIAPDPATGKHRGLGDPADVARGALSLQSVRESLEQLVTQRRKTDPALNYLDGRALFPPEETADLYDGVHPNPAGYLRMGARLADILAAYPGLL
ncbi:GDSL-type esterase/lipase family protein [Streptomyces sp. NPDC057137]|uniref:GDSL-type esterase/lipase family protein n=1 Tax=Streptomyces sp. NPDC057137 TaxID=3346030 RepID=UPI003627D42E